MPKIEDIPDDLLARAMAEPEPEPPTEKPTAAKAKRTRAKKAATGKTATAANPATMLLKAIKFLEPAQSKTGTVNETFCHLSHGWAAASNGILTIASKIEEDLTACPQTKPFIDALNRVETDMSITQLSAGFLSVSSGDFRAVVPCAPMDQVPISPPDEPVAVIDDRLKVGFKAVLKIPNEASPRPEYAGVLLQAGSIVATNGAIIFEFWHGIDLPPNMLIPKIALTAILKAKSPLAQLGFSERSVTFWFEDGSFIKTATFAAQYPAYQNTIECNYGDMWPVPDAFFKAVESVASFSENASVFFKNGQIASSMSGENPSFYRIDGLPDGVGFDGKYIALIDGQATRLLFTDDHDKDGRNDIPRVYFVGENLRGVIAGLENKEAAVYSPNDAQPHGRDCQCPDCEIPF